MTNEQIKALMLIEGDERKFEKDGVKCIIIRHPSLKHLCGYIDLTRDFSEYGKSYDELNVHCHGGLTYSEQNDKYWRIGFDCAHSGDLSPGMMFIENTPTAIFNMFDTTDIYRDMEYVENEIIKLLKQLDGTIYYTRRNRELKLKDLDDSI